MEICTRSEIIDARTVLNDPTFTIRGFREEISTEPINWFFDARCEEVFITADEDEYNDIVFDSQITPIGLRYMDGFKGTIYMDRFDDKLKGVLLVRRPYEPDWDEM